MAVYTLSKPFKPIARKIVTDVVVTNPINGREYKTKGLWDTGATGSVITKSTAKALGLIPIGMTQVRGVHGVRSVNIYRAKITLHNKKIFLTDDVTECNELSSTHDIGMLIGMNIISKGDFSISNYKGETVISFRVPSLERKDFVAEHNEFKKIQKIYKEQSKQGIEKCPCGSGKNFKNCHGKSIYNVK